MKKLLLVGLVLGGALTVSRTVYAKTAGSEPAAINCNWKTSGGDLVAVPLSITGTSVIAGEFGGSLGKYTGKTSNAKVRALCDKGLEQMGGLKEMGIEEPEKAKFSGFDVYSELALNSADPKPQRSYVA